MNKLSDIKLEKDVLYLLIHFPNTYIKVASKLSIDLFTTQLHKRIYILLNRLLSLNKPCDLLIMSKELDEEASTYILSLNSVAVTANIERYTMYLVELAVKRDFIRRFSVLHNLVNTDVDIFELRDKTYDTINNIFLDNFIESNKGIPHFSEILDDVEKKFSGITQDNGITGIATSLNVFNDALGGWQDSNLTIIAARPAMGKTSLLVQIVVDTSLQHKHVGVFSLEMSKTQLATKVVTNITSIPNSSMLRKGLSKEELIKYYDTKEVLNNLKIHIDDTPSLSIQNLRLKAKIMKMRFDIKILLVDYLQLIKSKGQNREQEVSNISQGLKALAKELNIPVIALSQLSRSVENRPGSKRPILSDLRDSGSLEQDADEVIFLYRPQYYNIENWDDEPHSSTENEVEIIVAKNRHGGLLPKRVGVHLPTSKFYNL